VNLDLIDRTVAMLREEEPTFDWVGVYLLEGDTLVLGPFRGKPTEHGRIPVGEGVCGSVAASGEPEVVPDVRRRSGHIVCDLETRSEAVFPLFRDGRVAGVLDVDSNTPDAFGEQQLALIEQAAREIAGE
jgi:putative methionine-R-sulfoxide reductase with GAF domain